MYGDIPAELRGLIEPVVADHGFELVDVELPGGRGGGVLRVTIDTPQCDGTVSIERCADVSRELATQLDAADAVAGSYRLEVSSPGLDRHLGREKDFRAVRGQEVRLETRHPVEGRRRFRGRLMEFEGGVATLLVDGSEVAIPFGAVAKATSVYEFSAADFGSGSTGHGRRSGRGGRQG